MIKLIKATFYNEKKTKKQLGNFITSSDYLTFGRECEKFEDSFARWQGRKYCVFVNSGSSANLAMIQSFLNLGKLKKDDYVGFSALTWSTNVMPIIQLGLKPVPVDIELDTLNVSSKKLKETLKKYPLKMLFVTNLLGFCDDLDEIKQLCDTRNILLIEDNCQSLGTKYRGKMLGNYGFASSFSFYVGHHMSTIEGGAVCTDSPILAKMLKIVRDHGLIKRTEAAFYSQYIFQNLGFNLRPTEIQGFIGNTQLPYLNTIIKKRNKNFFKITRSLYLQPEKFYQIKYDHLDFLSNFAIPIICRNKIIRDALIERCSKKIETRPIVSGDMTRQPFFEKYQKDVVIESRNAKIVYEQGLYIPNNPELTEAEIKTVSNIIVSI